MILAERHELSEHRLVFGFQSKTELSENPDEATEFASQGSEQPKRSAIFWNTMLPVEWAVSLGGSAN